MKLSSSTKVLFSLIIPIYNVPRNLLISCLDSVVSQLGPHIDCECLLIDDGSTDGSADICDNYARQHSIFQVFHKENQGNCFARNYGIQHAHGEWVLFLDDDDYLLDDYYYNVFSSVDTYGSHFNNICFNHKRLSHKDNDQEYIAVKRNAPLRELKIHTIDRSSFNARCVIWTHIYNRKWLVKNRIKFPETYTCEPLHQYRDEDSYFNCLCYNYDTLILELPFYGIAHRIREGSTNQKQKQLQQPPRGQYLLDLYNDIMRRDVHDPRLCNWLCKEAERLKIPVGNTNN